MQQASCIEQLSVNFVKAQYFLYKLFLHFVSRPNQLLPSFLMDSTAVVIDCSPEAPVCGPYFDCFDTSLDDGSAIATLLRSLNIGGVTRSPDGQVWNLPWPQSFGDPYRLVAELKMVCENIVVTGREEKVSIAAKIPPDTASTASNEILIQAAVYVSTIKGLTRSPYKGTLCLLRVGQPNLLGVMVFSEAWKSGGGYDSEREIIEVVLRDNEPRWVDDCAFSIKHTDKRGSVRCYEIRFQTELGAREFETAVKLASAM